MIFYTATGGASLISSDADLEASLPVANEEAIEEDNGFLSESVLKRKGTASARRKQSKRLAEKKLPSAIALHHSKHDMTRVEFALALMALARYKQRHMKRYTTTAATTDPVGAENKAVSGGRSASTTAGRTSDTTHTSGSQQQLSSCEEFMHILEIQILGPLNERAKKFIGDKFREEVRFLPSA
jgi:hypothetical protein